VSASFRLPRLYPIVDVREESPEAIERALRLAVELAAAGATLLQLRAKPLAAGVMTVLASRMVAAAAAQGARVIVNDRADVALAAGAAGVHVGDEDLPVAAARDVLGPGAIVGYSTHTIDDVAAAGRLPADYLGFGPVFDSPTKAGVRDPRGIELLAEACRASPLPVVAIGGITLARAPDCWRAGAASVAVISEIERAPDRGGLVRAYLRSAIS
jgi:thiamine-phosphate pyrophosphorylase